jgi:hypothetical protein
MLLSVLAVSACGRLPLQVQIPECHRLLKASGLLDPTPLPDDPGPTVGALGSAYVAALGSIVKANADKAGADRLASECEEVHRDMLAKATRRRFLGL